MRPPVLFDPVHFRCPYCKARCVAGVAPWLDNAVARQVIHELPVCKEAEQLGPSVVLEQANKAIN